MNDFFGNPISVGDLVVYSERQGSSLSTALVEELKTQYKTPTTVLRQYYGQGKSSSFAKKKEPHYLVVVPRAWKP